MENITLKINKMECTGCAQRLERALKNTDGVIDAKVDFEIKKAQISFNDEIISADEICETISDTGFEAEK